MKLYDTTREISNDANNDGNVINFSALHDVKKEIIVVPTYRNPYNILSAPKLLSNCLEVNRKIYQPLIPTDCYQLETHNY